MIMAKAAPSSPTRPPWAGPGWADASAV